MSKNQTLWNGEELADIFEQQVSKSVLCSGVSIDSRTMKKGDIFIAIKGPNFDGHQFVETAIQKGASCVIVSQKPSSHTNMIFVDDTMEALLKVARAARKRLLGIPIGITGSVGKTTSKEMLKVALKSRENIHTTVGSLNNHIGLPLTLANMPQGTSIAILEMGMNHADELRHLSKLCIPKIGVITGIAAVHSEFFKSVEDIAYAKSEIFEGMNEKDIALLSHGTLHYDVLYRNACDAKLNIVTFGTADHCDAQLLEVEQKNDKLHVRARFFDNTITYVIPTCGLHFAINSVCALMIARLTNNDIEEAAHNLQHFEPIRGRGNKIVLKNGITLLDESYNSSPVAVQAALKTLSYYRNTGSANRLIAILGDMGETQQRFHVELLEHILESGVDIVFTVGVMMKALHDMLPNSIKGVHTTTSEEMSEVIATRIEKGDVVLIKGGRFLKMEQIMNQIINGHSHDDTTQN
ncbi:UDP-N-acetylmuramoyl-tripeptide--D-alanyl-D-alanine ligase [Rickettsiales endosymbiont of Peranema trichophorum]|uniref:UDP-N-acetylmuramoyl-tripeptide--D-alanyl-D- alanine ligase n=1 Tax=Rickettsiales endosymbiont of Peranema trichophorum TaxID=2486577 RepID=UPI001023E4B5|nr:UDP-N-acetylmuramoyl-tripeptide--D-alanyl-D-alanine ligase [Rickettsiales endosymbiont of Peranema trichophorum]RZI47394.1 UDP-N-acetylmuramoyl-tripeptide--D-alanyl-D-alanine ligase [Rickettsiales endosymbiont of Peranema trichophorum]